MNVEAQVRLSVLEGRIYDLEAELSWSETPHVVSRTVELGSTVVVDFGDGAESYLYAPVDHAPPGVDVITPASPVGRALLGAAAGDTVSYSLRAGRSATAVVLDVH